MPATLRSIRSGLVTIFVTFLAWHSLAGVAHADPITVTASPDNFVIAKGGSITSTLSGVDENPPESATATWKFEADAPGSVIGNTLTAVFPDAGEYKIEVRGYVSYDGGTTWKGPGTTTVIVNAISVTFAPSPVYVAVGGTASLTATATPAAASCYVFYTTANGSIATVSGVAPDLTVAGVSTGTTEVQAILNGDVIASVTVYVAWVTFSPDPFYVWVTKSDTLTATITPIEAAAAVEINITDTGIATYTGTPPTLTVTGVAAGETQIVGSVGDDDCGSGEIKVVDISYDPDPIDVAEGDWEYTSVTVTPTSASIALTFLAEDPSIAGITWEAPTIWVEGIKAGETDVVPYLKGVAGTKKLKCTVIKVVFAPDPVVVVADGGTAPVVATVTPASAIPKVTFDTETASVATVAGTAPSLTVTGGATSSTTWLRGKLGAKFPWKVKVFNVRVSLKEVSFSGGNHAIVNDDGTTALDAPQWRNTVFEFFGAHISLPDRRYPVAYTRSQAAPTKPTWEAKFLVTPALPATVAVKVKGSGSEGIKIPETDGAIAGTEVTIPATVAGAGNNFDNKVRYINTFDITWEMKFNAAPYTAAGTSQNKHYLTWATPVGAPIIHTVLHVGCTGANNLGGTADGPDDNPVLEAIWGKFATLSINRVSDNRLLTYYGYLEKSVPPNGTYEAGTDEDRNTTDNNLKTTAPELIAWGNGQCHSWMDFFGYTLRAQGLAKVNKKPLQRATIVAETAGAAAGRTYWGLAVHNWRTNGGSPWKIVEKDLGVDGSKAPKVLAAGEAEDDKGVPGQGNSPNPQGFFWSHYILEINGVYYDPSYGIRKTSQAAYEAAAFKGSIYKDAALDDFIDPWDGTNKWYDWTLDDPYP